MRHTALALATALTLTASSALAQDAPPAEVVRGGALTGGWSADCAAPSSVANPRATYAIPANGPATLSYDLGARYEPRAYALDNVRGVSAERVAYDQENLSTHTRAGVVLVLEADRIRVWSSVGADGKSFIADGVLADGGTETKWFNRCP